MFGDIRPKAMEPNPVNICCNIECGARFDCRLFAAALDVNAGKIKHYNIIQCINFNYYQK